MSAQALGFMLVMWVAIAALSVASLTTVLKHSNK